MTLGRERRLRPALGGGILDVGDLADGGPFAGDLAAGDPSKDDPATGETAAFQLRVR